MWFSANYIIGFAILYLILRLNKSELDVLKIITNWTYKYEKIITITNYIQLSKSISKWLVSVEMR